jgi:hypothetical protein
MLKYIEHIDKLGHRGQAWIGFVEVSRSGRTVYFNGMALQRIPGGGVNGNHRDVETGDEYWISGVKKKGTNRHWAGGGEILVEKRALSELLELRGWTSLPHGYKLTSDIVPTNVEKFVPILNEAERDHRPTGTPFRNQALEPDTHR